MTFGRYIPLFILNVRPKWGEWSTPRPDRFTPGEDPLGPSGTVAPQNEKISAPSSLIITEIFTREGKKTGILFSAKHDY